MSEEPPKQVSLPRIGPCMGDDWKHNAGMLCAWEEFGGVTVECHFCRTSLISDFHGAYRQAKQDKIGWGRGYIPDEEETEMGRKGMEVEMALGGASPVKGREEGHGRVGKGDREREHRRRGLSRRESRMDIDVGDDEREARPPSNGNGNGTPVPPRIVRHDEPAYPHNQQQAPPPPVQPHTAQRAEHPHQLSLTTPRPERRNSEHTLAVSTNRLAHRRNSEHHLHYRERERQRGERPYDRPARREQDRRPSLAALPNGATGPSGPGGPGGPGRTPSGAGPVRTSRSRSRTPNPPPRGPPGRDGRAPPIPLGTSMVPHHKGMRVPPPIQAPGHGAFGPGSATPSAGSALGSAVPSRSAWVPASASVHSSNTSHPSSHSSAFPPTPAAVLQTPHKWTRRGSRDDRAGSERERERDAHARVWTSPESMGSDGSRHTPEGYASHMREQEAQINQHVQRYAHPNGHVNQDPNQHHKPSHPRQPHFPRHVAVTPGLTTAVRGWSAGWTKGIERKTELVFVGQVPAKGERERARRERLERQGRSMSRGSAGSGSAFSQ